MIGLNSTQPFIAGTSSNTRHLREVGQPCALKNACCTALGQTNVVELWKSMATGLPQRSPEPILRNSGLSSSAINSNKTKGILLQYYWSNQNRTMPKPVLNHQDHQDQTRIKPVLKPGPNHNEATT